MRTRASSAEVPDELTVARGPDPFYPARTRRRRNHGQGHRIASRPRSTATSPGPDDGPEYGLGKGGERLHYWVMGGPWTYDGGHEFAMHGPDKEFYDELVSTISSGIVGRGMYDAAGAWGGTNPFPGPLFVLTHRTEDQPAPEAGFTFVSGLDDGAGPGARRRRLRRRLDRRRCRGDPGGAGGRAGRRARHLDGTGDPGRRQAALRRVRPGRRPRGGQGLQLARTPRTCGTPS